MQKDYSMFPSCFSFYCYNYQVMLQFFKWLLYSCSFLWNWEESFLASTPSPPLLGNCPFHLKTCWVPSVGHQNSRGWALQALSGDNRRRWNWVPKRPRYKQSGNLFWYFFPLTRMLRYPLRCTLCVKMLKTQVSDLNLLGKPGIHNERCSCLYVFIVLKAWLHLYHTIENTFLGDCSCLLWRF